MSTPRPQIIRSRPLCIARRPSLLILSAKIDTTRIPAQMALQNIATDALLLAQEAERAVIGGHTV